MILPPFKNEPFIDFTDETNAAAMHTALANAEAEFGREYPVVINREKISTGDLLDSYNPSNFNQVVGRVHRATQELADNAILPAPGTSFRQAFPISSRDGEDWYCGTGRHG